MTTNDLLTEYLTKLQSCEPSKVRIHEDMYSLQFTQPTVETLPSGLNYKLIFLQYFRDHPYPPPVTKCRISAHWMEDVDAQLLECATLWARALGCQESDVEYAFDDPYELAQQQAQLLTAHVPNELLAAAEDRHQWWLAIALTTTNAQLRQIAQQMLQEGK